MSGASSLGEQLQALELLFAAPPGNPPESLRALLDSLPSARAALLSPQRQVTVLGRTQTGKSSLINALIGAPVLPVRVNRGTGAVTSLRFAERPAAAVVRPGGQEEPLALHALPATVLLDLSPDSVRPAGDIDEVRIELPLPLLPANLSLVDTPGIGEDERLTERIYRELERTDLAVVVLAADQVLSARDRQVAHHLHDLLQGNVVFVVNRLDLIDVEDRAEVLAWVGQALHGVGNALIGEAPIFATAVPPAHSADSEAGEGPTLLRAWLEGRLLSERGAQVAMLARLGRLQRLLALLSAGAQTELAAAHTTTAQAQAAEGERVGRERAEIRRRLSLARAQLGGNAVLGPLGEAFVRHCVEDTRQHRAAASHGSAIRVQVDGALAAFAAGVAEYVQTLLLDLPVTAPPFDLSTWIMRAEVTAAHHPTSDAGALFGGFLTQVIDGGSTGRAAGESLGGWVGKHVFGVDIEAETLKRVEGAARGVAQSLRAEAEAYLVRIDALLQAADEFYSSWTPGAPHLAAVHDQEHSLEELTAWCARWQREVSGLTAELTATA